MASLAAEINKSGPFESLEQEAHLNIIRTAHELDVAAGRLFKPRGLSSPGYNILRILRGSEGHKKSCSEIKKDLVTQVPDVTRLLDRLEREGYVERTRCTEDRRVVYARLTDQGRDALEDLDAPVLELHRGLLGHLSEEELQTLSDLLVKARNPEHAEV